jgi:plasmid stability protein
MASLTLKGMPDELLERLRRSAEANRRSLNQEAIARLEEAVGLRPRDARAALARLDETRSGMRLKPVTSAFLKRARKGGRP